MNITKAWIEAKKKGIGTKIHSKTAGITLVYNGVELAFYINNVSKCPLLYSDEAVCADDWEVVMEKRRQEFTVARVRFDFNWSHYPPDAKVTIEWEE